MANDLDWAWFAGLFEGEGCLVFTGVNSVTLRINMTDEDVLRRVHALLGGSCLPHKKYEANRKPQWVWYLSKSQEVRNVLEHIHPHMGQRRSQRIEEGLKRLDNVRREGYCKRGHPMNSTHLYISPGGQRYCRTCAKAREEQRKR